MKLSFFISYSRRDEHIVYRYAGDIKQHLNVNTWIDKDDIPTGRDWWEGICEGIHECDFFMLFLSPHSADSKYCMAELQYAHALNKVVLPIMIAETNPLPDVIAVNRINYYNLIHYKDSRDVLLGLSRDIFYHLSHPRKIKEVLPPKNPNDESNTTNKPQAITSNNVSGLFRKATNAIKLGEYEIASNILKQIVQGDYEVPVNKAQSILQQLKNLIELQEASNQLKDILYALDNDFIDRQIALQEFEMFLLKNSDLGFPTSFDDIQMGSYQDALHKIMEVRRNENAVLIIKGIGLKYLPPEIGLLPYLKELDASANELRTLPPTVNNLNGLTILDLSYNQFETIPDCVTNLTHLEKLLLSDNQLNSLTDTINNLHDLKELNLGDNHLKNLPDTIGNLSKLTSLAVFSNKLTVVPQSIGNLAQLRELHLWDNQLGELPDSICNLSDLTHLYLSSNKLACLPDIIGNLYSLTHLHLSNNKLACLPDAIRYLTNLTFLMLNENPLMEIPDSIFDIKQLAELDVRSIQLSKLSQKIKKLSLLKVLLLSSNKLTDIPLEVGILENLEHLMVEYNPLTDLPDRVKRTNEEILTWLREEAKKL